MPGSTSFMDEFPKELKDWQPELKEENKEK